jgi:hypothetical protein
VVVGRFRTRSCSSERLRLSEGKRKALLVVTIIEIRPFRNGWKCFEAPGVEPVFLDQEQAIDYAQTRANFVSGEIRILKSNGAVERVIVFDERSKTVTRDAGLILA